MPLKLLGYPSDSFFGQVLRARCLPDVHRRFTVETVCESAFTAGIKQMALAGMGIAWLPYGLVAPEIRESKLHVLTDRFRTFDITVVLYARSGGRSAEVEHMWRTLMADADPLVRSPADS